MKEKVAGNGCGKYCFQIIVSFLAAFININACLYMSLPIFASYRRNYTCASDDLLDACSENCTEWKFDDSTMKVTVQSKYNLVCDRQYLLAWTASLCWFGMIAGNIIYGYLADRFGRRRMFLIASVHATSVGIMKTFAPDVKIYLATNFFSGVAVAGYQNIGMTFINEIVAKDKRNAIANSFFFGAPMANYILVLAAYLSKDMTITMLFVALSNLLFALAFFLPESPKWLVSRGRLEEAKVAVIQIEKMNGGTGGEIETEVALVSKLLENNEKETETNKLTAEEILLFETKAAGENEAEHSKQIHRRLLRTPCFLRSAVILTLLMVVTGLAYYGLYYGVGVLTGDLYVNYCIIVLPGLVTGIQYGKVIGWLGGHKFLTGSCILCSVSCFLAGCLSEYRWASLFIGMVGIYFADSALQLAMTYAAEMYPTEMRTIGVGGSMAFARFGSSMVSHIIQACKHSSPLLHAVFGGPLLFFGILSIFLPETTAIELPKTVEEANERSKLQNNQLLKELKNCVTCACIRKQKPSPNEETNASNV